MASDERVSYLCNQLHLTPYQSYILESNAKKYDMGKLVKRGGMLYAPYAHDDRGSIANYAARILFGPRADLIGPDRMLVIGERGIHVHQNGFYAAHKNGTKYYADSFNNPINNIAKGRVFR